MLLSFTLYTMDQALWMLMDQAENIQGRNIFCAVSARIFSSNHYLNNNYYAVR